MKLVTCLLLILLAPATLADRQWFYDVSVRETVIDDSKFGQCMARLRSVDIPGALPNCKAGYVTFDCAAELEGSSKSVNSKKYDIATISLLAKRKAAFLVTDEKTINGYCYVAQARLI